MPKVPHDDPAVTDRQAYMKQYMRQYRAGGKGKRGVPLQDRKVLLSVRIRASIMGRVQRILLEGMAHRTHNFRNTSQLVQALLLAGLESMAGTSEVIDEALQYLRAVASTDEIGQRRKEAQAAFAIVKTELTELLAINAEDQARHYFHATRHEFMAMSPNVWRDWFLKELDANFPKLLLKPASPITLSHTLKETPDAAPTPAPRPARLVQLPRGRARK